MESTHYAVLGDIGGTNFRLRLVKIQENGGLERVKEIFYQSSKYTTFANFINKLLLSAEVPQSQLKYICMAVRGYQKGKFYSEYEKESAEDLQEYYKESNPQIHFFHDIEGMALAIEYHDELKPGMIVQLKHDKTQEVPHPETKVKLLFSMGTGNGGALVIPYPTQELSPDGVKTTKYQQMVRSTELWRWFQCPDPNNERQNRLGRFIFDKMKTASSIEKFCKGAGIFSLYNFMVREHPDMKTDILPKIKKSIKTDGKKKKVKKTVWPQECITYAAINGMDPLCEMTIDFLIEIIASCLQRFTLAALPMGGIYLGGGVTNYLCDYIVKKQEIFWNHYLNHPYMRESILEKVPIYIMRENPTLDNLEVWLGDKVRGQL